MLFLSLLLYAEYHLLFAFRRLQIKVAGLFHDAELRGLL